MESDKPITSMPSHHNLNDLFTVLNDSSTTFFHELDIAHREEAIRVNKSQALPASNMMNITMTSNNN